MGVVDHGGSRLTEPAAVLRARDCIDRRENDWRELLRELIGLPSTFEAEHTMVSQVAREVCAIGLNPILVPMDAVALRHHPDAVEPISTVADRNNVVVRIPGSGGGRSLVLNCHLDINPEGDPAEWTHPPFSGHVDTERNVIFGRGAMDDKAGVAICLGLMRALTEQRVKLDGDLIFQFVLEDEITGNGSLACLEAGHAGDAAFILDGTRQDRAIDQHAGNMEFHLTLKGRPASVSVSHMGANAAELLSRAALHLRDRFHQLNDRRQPPWTEFPSPYQFVIHSLSADAHRFSVPTTAQARCFVTFPPPDTIDSVRRFLLDECRRHAEANSFPHPPELSWNAFAAEPVCSATDEQRALLHRVAERNGIAGLRIGPSTGTSDMRHFAKRGIPCLLYGPGRGYNPHRPDEYFMLDDLPFMMKVYLDMVVDWCGVARS